MDCSLLVFQSGLFHLANALQFILVANDKIVFFCKAEKHSIVG